MEDCSTLGMRQQKTSSSVQSILGVRSWRRFIDRVWSSRFTAVSDRRRWTRLLAVTQLFASVPCTALQSRIVR